MALGWREQYNRYRGYFLNIVNLYKQRADLRAFTEVILSIGTIVVFLLFALKPTALTIISLAREINEKKQTDAALSKKISDLNKATTTFNQSQSEIQNVNIAVASIPKPEIISGQIIGIAAKDTVNVLGISVGEITLVGKESKPKTSKDVKPLPESAFEMPVSISVQGNYQNLILFLEDLENLRVATKIDRISLGSSENKGERVIVALISLRVPYTGSEK